MQANSEALHKFGLLHLCPYRHHILHWSINKNEVIGNHWTNKKLDDVHDFSFRHRATSAPIPWPFKTRGDYPDRYLSIHILAATLETCSTYWLHTGQFRFQGGVFGFGTGKYKLRKILTNWSIWSYHRQY